MLFRSRRLERRRSDEERGGQRGSEGKSRRREAREPTAFRRTSRKNVQNGKGAHKRSFVSCDAENRGNGRIKTSEKDVAGRASNFCDQRSGRLRSTRRDGTPLINSILNFFCRAKTVLWKFAILPKFLILKLRIKTTVRRALCDKWGKRRDWEDGLRRFGVPSTAKIGEKRGKNVVARERRLRFCRRSFIIGNERNASMKKRRTKN